MKIFEMVFSGNLVLARLSRNDNILGSKVSCCAHVRMRYGKRMNSWFGCVACSDSNGTQHCNAAKRHGAKDQKKRTMSTQA